MRTVLVAVRAALLLCIGCAALATGAEPWCNTLLYDGGNYWRLRVPVEIENMSNDALKGTHVRIRITSSDSTSTLIGQAVGTLRVTDANSADLLFNFETSAGQEKRDGTVAAGDVIVVPATVAGQSTGKIYIYAENPDAWRPPSASDFANRESSLKRFFDGWLGRRGDPEGAEDRVKTRVLSPEKFELKVEGADEPWIADPEWAYRVPLRVRNFGDENVTGRYFIVNARRIYNRLVKLLGFRAKPALRLIDPREPGRAIAISGSLTEHLVGSVFVAPRTEQVLWLYISANPEAQGRSPMVNFPHGHRDLGWSTTDCRDGDIEAREAQVRPLVAWSVNSLVKVFREDLPLGNAPREVKVHAARNSRRASSRKVRIKATPLRSANGDELPPPQLYRVGYVPVDVPVNYSAVTDPDYHRLSPQAAKMKSITSSGDPAEGPSKKTFLFMRHGRPLPVSDNDGWSNDWWPDPLIPMSLDTICVLETRRTQPIWFDLNVPAEARPGQYFGEIEIGDDRDTVRMPVQVKVWRIVMPNERHFSALLDLRSGSRDIFRERGATEKWHRFLARYNVSPSLIESQPEFSLQNGRVTMKTEAFDKMAGLLIDELHVGKLYTPSHFYGSRSFKNPNFREEYKLFVDHITTKGWRKHFVFYVADEPGNDYHASDIWEGILRVADTAKQIAPDIPIFVSTWHYYPLLENRITCWGIGNEGSFPPRMIDERRKAGDRFWYTTDGQMCIDTPYLANERLLPWFGFKYAVEAYEFWGVSWYTYNPWKYAWHPFLDRRTHKFRFPNGDGYLAYPGEELGLSEPVPSIRLMGVREGIDDFEIFLELEKYAKAGNRLAEQALERVKSLVITPNMSGVFSTNVMPDPDAVQAAWIEAGELLDQLLNLL